MGHKRNLLFRAWNQVFLAVAITFLSAPVNAAWVTSPSGAQSLNLGSGIIGAGPFDEIHDFTLNANAEVTYTTQRYNFFESFNDFSATLYRVISDNNLLTVISGVDTVAVMGYSNDFYLPSLGAGNYRLQIRGMDPEGFGYAGMITLLSVAQVNVNALQHEIPEPTTLAIMFCALLALRLFARGQNSSMPSGNVRST